MTDIFPDLEKRPPKQRELFSDKEINSNKILEIDFKDIEKNPKESLLMPLQEGINTTTRKKNNQSHHEKRGDLSPLFLYPMTISLINWLLEKLVEFVKKYL